MRLVTLMRYCNEQIEKEVMEEMEEPTPFSPYVVSSYGADYTVDMLVKRLKNKDVDMPPFQRGFVWTYGQSCRFIESLLLGLPVPGIFLSKEFESQKHLVIDGQQRLRSLQYFCDGWFEPSKKPFILEGVQKQFQGITYATLKVEDRRRFDDSIIHATIVRQDKPEEDNSSVYYLFERLNTGGTLLQPQEIRAAIFQGPFNNLIANLNSNPTWRTIYGGNKPHLKLRDQELILRFFAFYYASDQFTLPLKIFLNKFMKTNQHLKKHSEEELSKLFTQTIEVAYILGGKNVFRLERAFLASLFDAAMVGLAKRLARGPITDFEKAKEEYAKLMYDKEYTDLLIRQTGDAKRVSA